MTFDIRTSAVSVADGIEARDNLVWIADRWPDLRARLHPIATGGSEIRTAPASKPPIDLVVSDLMFEIEEEARSLGHVLLDETDWTPRTSHMPGLLRDVADRYGHWITSDDRTALAFTDWAHDYKRRVERALERPVPPYYIGPCWEDCAGDVYLKRGRSHGQCTWCKEQWDVAERMDWVHEQLKSRLMTRSEIVTALSILGTPSNKDTVKSWTRRGDLPEVAPNLFRLADAMPLAERTRGRPPVRQA